MHDTDKARTKQQQQQQHNNNKNKQTNKIKKIFIIDEFALGNFTLR